MSKPHLSHLGSATDLVTTHEATRAGFIALALEKNRRATPHVKQARALYSAASEAVNPRDLLLITPIQSALLTAAGVSDKAANYLMEEDRRAAILGLIENFLEPEGEKFVEELVFRFLLIRGDTLGGSMRNMAGFVAQSKFTRALLAYLKLTRMPCRWLNKKSWAEVPLDDTGIEQHLTGLSWGASGRERTLRHNVRVALVGSNIDLVILNCSLEKCGPKTLRDPSAYVALGELKGGIDPAGADEHWKTASTALGRIRDSFGAKGQSPHTFFIGAAIEARMAQELWARLGAGTIENAANLTNEGQLAAIARWICSL